MTCKFGGVLRRIHSSVEPHQAERAVVGEQFAELRLGLGFQDREKFFLARS